MPRVVLIAPPDGRNATPPEPIATFDGVDVSHAPGEITVHGPVGGKIIDALGGDARRTFHLRVDDQLLTQCRVTHWAPTAKLVIEFDEVEERPAAD